MKLNAKIFQRVRIEKVLLDCVMISQLILKEDLNLDILLKFSSGGAYRNSPEINDFNLYSFY